MNSSCDFILQQYDKDLSKLTSSEFLQNINTMENNDANYIQFISQEYLFMMGLIRLTGVTLSNAPPFAFRTLSKSIFRFNEYIDFLKEKLNQRKIIVSKIEEKSETKEYIAFFKSLYSENFKVQLLCLWMTCYLFNMTLVKNVLPKNLNEIIFFLKNIQFDQICDLLKKDVDNAFSIEDKGDYHNIYIEKLISLELNSWNILNSTNQ
jgi:thiaminase